MCTEHPGTSNMNMCEYEWRPHTGWQQSNRPCTHVLICTLDLCGRRVWRIPGSGGNARAHAPMHTLMCPNGVGRVPEHWPTSTRTEPGDMSASRCPRGGGQHGMRLHQPSWVRGLRRPGTAIHVLNSHSPGPGGTVPDLRTLLAPQFAQPLYSPAGAVTHGLCRQACFPQAQAHLFS